MAVNKVKLHVELLDGSQHDITIDNPSLVAWDRERGRNNWPTATDAPYLWMTFIAWHHLKATGVHDFKWADFSEKQCLEVGDPAGGEEDAADPTQPEPEPA